MYNYCLCFSLEAQPKVVLLVLPLLEVYHTMQWGPRNCPRVNTTSPAIHIPDNTILEHSNHEPHTPYKVCMRTNECPRVFHCSQTRDASNENTAFYNPHY
ncbi:hypothetical protein JTE90_021241 [Oedothorax gibbosus]|uniref:Secreted protein n=1 Tax=Oedothorax gibbosus TaxID=931172 RepID=A0AAV6UUR1_9ARAC|nr:hypothetical protein JTE90_021241 [Oedothorax gibbosus]